MEKTKIGKMVDRFLGWKLPTDFSPDGGVTLTPSHVTPSSPLWPTGTNLLTADQARQMFEHAIGDEENNEFDRLRGLILRATAELEIVEYDNDPPARVSALLDELRAVNRGALLGG